jgi:hypothetical protein
METILIRIRKETKDRLMKFRMHPRETYDEVIARLMASQTDRDPISEDTLKAIEEGLSDIRNKKTRELKKRKRAGDPFVKNVMKSQRL